MIKAMKLKGQLRLEADQTITFVGKLFDGSPFDLKVGQHDYEQNDPFTEERSVVDGWLMVEMEAKQDTRCYLTLPKPSLVHGKQIVVRELQLMPRHASIDDFRPQKQGGKTVESDSNS